MNATYRRILNQCSAAILFAGAASAQYVWQTDFNSGYPEVEQLRGDASRPSSGGVSDSGHLMLTPAVGGAHGDVTLGHFWPEGETPAEFTIRFSMRLGGNSGGVIGDGLSVSFAGPLGPELIGEGGVGSGPKLCIDTYDNDGSDGGVHLFSGLGSSRYAPAGPPNRISTLLGNRNNWHSVEYKSNLWSKACSFKYDGQTILSRSAIEGASPTIIPDGRFILGARTGDAFSSHQIDDIYISVTPYPIFKQQPRPMQVTSGQTVLFTAKTNFHTLPWQGIGTYTLAASATTEWQIKHPGGTWTVVPETTDPVLWNSQSDLILRHVREDAGLWEGDDPAWSIDGTEVRCVCRWHNGYEVFSQSTFLHVLPLPSEQPGAKTLFNTSPMGQASIAYEIESDKILRLTSAQPDQLGAFVLDEMRSDAAQRPQHVSDFIFACQLRATQPSEERADGISINIASDLPAGIPQIPVEEGVGSGLTLSFDSYSNGPADIRGLNIRWGGATVMDFGFVEPLNDDWLDVYVRVQEDGTLDVALNGQAIVFNRPLLGWQGLREPQIGLYGRTGAFWQQQDVRLQALSFTANTLVWPMPTLECLTQNGVLRLYWATFEKTPCSLEQSSDCRVWVPCPLQVFESPQLKQVFCLMSERDRLFFRLRPL